ncbi:unnamed protein product [Cylicocyclus nassatus]|uniref:Uncharacterized protein n=1 Tax=Cylicocyclus nassatus TaxID=53992 RepID=A0AA36HFL7_CYLNA|nr:unnamed protein product [Cylicocyclus nassatus]
MRYFVGMLLLLLVLEVVVESRRWKGKPDVCRYMFVNPRIAFKKCGAACWKRKNCWGYCDVKHGRKRCICGDCERACPPAPTEQPATSPPAPTEQPITSPTAQISRFQIKLPTTMIFPTDLPYDETQLADYDKSIKAQFLQSMTRHNITYGGLGHNVRSQNTSGNLTTFILLPEFDCNLATKLVKEMKESLPHIMSAVVRCEDGDIRHV